MFFLYVILLFVCFSYAHPPSTFGQFVTQINGTFPFPIFTGGEINRIPFILVDLLKEQRKIPLANIIPMHGKYIHTLITSPDMEWAYHLHPEDFGSLQEMEATGAYWVDAFLPTSGVWNIASEFVFQNGTDLREGSGQDYFVVKGGMPSAYPEVWDYSVTKNFKSYPLPPNQVFNSPIEVNDNTDPNGYEVTMTIGNGVNLTDVSIQCQPIFFHVKYNNGSDAMNLVPYLDAAAHITFGAYEDTIYHGHAIPLMPGQDWNDIVDMIKNMPMNSTMGDTMMDITMINAMMIGVNTSGYNCLVDEARVMTMMGMNLNLFYGTSPFGPTIVSLFDFPNTGYWRVFAYFAVSNEHNATELIVATFDVEVPPPPVNTYESSSTTSSGVKFNVQISSSLLMILLVLKSFLF